MVVEGGECEGGVGGRCGNAEDGRCICPYHSNIDASFVSLW